MIKIVSEAFDYGVKVRFSIEESSGPERPETRVSIKPSDYELVQEVVAAINELLAKVET